jgi:hypothetical protein
MSNQLQITGGAKVRNLEGVITGSTGVLNSLPINGANGIPQLDSSGKILVSQLPNSVMEYQGTWNVATNTPYLVNGVGNAGDVYLVTGAATGGTNHNFGAGNILFYNGDQAIYDGSAWQRASGSTGTVTSVAVSESSDALSITGSPITTSGTINIGFAGTSAQYVAGDGSLITFPALTGYVPYTGATSDVDLGTHVLNAQALHVKGVGGNGHLGLKHQSATPTGSANESLLFADVNGDLGWQNDNLYLTTLVSHANTANRTYTFPDASGTLALTSDLSAYVTLATTQTISGAKTFSSGVVISNTGNQPLKLADYATGLTALAGYTTIGANASGFQILNGGGKGANFIFGSSTYGYYLPSSNGTIALTSDIPTISATAPISYSAGVISISQATTSTNGYLSSTDWNTFNGKQSALSGTGFVKISGTTISYDNTSYLPLTGGTITTTSSGNALTIINNGTGYGLYVQGGASYFQEGASIQGTATLVAFGASMLKTNSSGVITSAVAGTDYQAPLTNPVTGTGTTNYLPKFTGTSAIGNSILQDNGNIGIGYTPNTWYAGYKVLEMGSGSLVFPNNATNTQLWNNLYINAAGNPTYKSTGIGGLFSLGGGGNAAVWYSAISGTAGTTASLSQIMTLTNGGSLGINNTSPSYTLDVTGTGRFTNTILAAGIGGNIRVSGNIDGGLFTNGGNNNIFLSDWNTATKGLYINLSTGVTTIQTLGSGTVSASSGTLSASSDMNLKIEDGFIDNALEKVMLLKPRYFYWKEESGLPTDIRQLGFYAQEVNETLGEEVSNSPKTDKEKWGIYDRGIIAMLTKAIQELETRLKTLENK